LDFYSNITKFFTVQLGLFKFSDQILFRTYLEVHHIGGQRPLHKVVRQQY
jgi:hypothetical protein